MAMVRKAISSQGISSSLNRRSSRVSARREIQVEQARAVDHMHLVDVRHADHAVHLAQFDAGAGFFEGLAPRRVGDDSPFSMKPAGRVHLP
jgi:hypothetical protein